MTQTQAELAKSDGRVRPKRIAHIALQTSQIDAISKWYCTFLNAWVVDDKPGMFATLSFDEEHHRIAIAALPPKPYGKFMANPEVVHVGYEMASLKDLLETWERLQGEGITPFLTVNHGSTVSFYWYDPDGNQCELFVDCFPTKRETSQWFETKAHQHNFGLGLPVDPADWLRRLRGGEPPEQIIAYDQAQGLAIDVPAVMREYAQALEDQTRLFEQAVADKMRSDAP